MNERYIKSEFRTMVNDANRSGRGFKSDNPTVIEALKTNASFTERMTVRNLKVIGYCPKLS